jgi:hypothetical protein
MISMLPKTTCAPSNTKSTSVCGARIAADLRPGSCVSRRFRLAEQYCSQLRGKLRGSVLTAEYVLALR